MTPSLAPVTLDAGEATTVGHVLLPTEVTRSPLSSLQLCGASSLCRRLLDRRAPGLHSQLHSQTKRAFCQQMQATKLSCAPTPMRR